MQAAPKAPEPQATDASAPRWLRYVPLVTGILAALAGFLTVRGANLANDAIYRSNQGVLFQSQASDSWAEYQAASVKARIVETALVTGGTDPAVRDRLTAQAKELRDRQPDLKTKAMDLERQRDAQLSRGNERLAEKDSLAYAGVAVQLGIGLASVAGITRRFEAFVVGILAGGAGLVMTATSLLSSLP